MSEIPLRYNCLCFVENRKIQKFMNAFDLTDRGHKCFGSFVRVTFVKIEPFTDEEFNRLLEAIKADDTIHLVYLNDRLIYNRGTYIMLSDGNRWISTRGIEEIQDETDNRTA